MRFSVRTLQAPVRWGVGAFTPGLIIGGAPATNGQNIVTGMPGTVSVPSPRPAALHSTDIGGPLVQPSSVSPDVIRPSIYVSHVNRTQLFPGRILGDNVTPVPARDPGRSPVAWQHKVRVGGQKVTPAVRPFTRYPVYGGK